MGIDFKNVRHIFVTIIVLLMAITSYAIWGESQLIIALIVAIFLEIVFWFRLSKSLKLKSS